MLYTSFNTITGIINCSSVQYQQETILSNLEKSFLDGNLDTLTGLYGEWDVNDKNPDYANASKPKAIVRSIKDRWQNIALIAIVYLSFFRYTCNKNVNLL